MVLTNSETSQKNGYFGAESYKKIRYFFQEESAINLADAVSSWNYGFKSH